MQALELARAGLEDARVKLERDTAFPPPPADDQKVYTYAEDLPVGGQPYGSYFVSLDTTYQGEPYSVVVVTSTGTVGPKDKPRAQRTLRAEFQLTPAPENLLKCVRFEDSGSL